MNWVAENAQRMVSLRIRLAHPEGYGRPELIEGDPRCRV